MKYQNLMLSLCVGLFLVGCDSRIDAVNMQKVVNGIGMAARFVVFIHERIAQPEVFQIGLGMFEALGQGIHIVIFVIGNRPFIVGHDLVFVIFHVRSVLLRELFFESRHL